MQVHPDRRRCKCQALNTVTRTRFCREQVSLSIYTQLLYFVMVDGRAKLPICKVLMNTLVLWLCFVILDFLFNDNHLSYSLLFSSDIERVHV
jgi:hypothetical protein